MNTFFEKSTVFITLIAISNFSNASQEEIKTIGFGISETKVKACELALNHARRDAAQTAIVQVESQFSSVASDSGAQHHEDRLLTTKAFARLIEQKEKASFDEDTGSIRCEVSASFKVGFVSNSAETVEVKQQVNQLSQSSEIVAQDFKTGEPFCSKKMNLCFREIYSNQLEEFGIQVLPPGYFRPKYLDNIDNHHFNFFFNKVSNRSNKGNVVAVTTKKALLELIDKKKEFAFLYVNKHNWSGERGGFLNRSSQSQRSSYAYDKNFQPIMNVINEKPGLFDSLDVTDKYLKELDDEMSRVNQALSNK